MTEHSTHDETAGGRAAREVERVLGQEMMSRRFITMPTQCRTLQSGALLVFMGILVLMVLQQVVSTDPAMQIAHQQRGAGTATGSIGAYIHPVIERNDP